MKKLVLILGGVAALIAVPVLAQRGGERPNPDSNGDGIVSRAEVDADVAKRFARMDVNKDGKLDKSDREAAMAARGNQGGEGGGDRGRGPMRADANGDGAVTLAEMRASAGQMFERADADKDGQLTDAERQAARSQMGKRRGGESGRAPQPAG